MKYNICEFELFVELIKKYKSVEGILVKENNCLQYIIEPDINNINKNWIATFHVHSGSCSSNNCFLSPPSNKDLRAFNRFYYKGIFLHYIIGKKYIYEVECYRAIKNIKHHIKNINSIQGDVVNDKEYIEKWFNYVSKNISSIEVVKYKL